MTAKVHGEHGITGSCPVCGALLSLPMEGTPRLAKIPRPLAAALHRTGALTPRERSVFRLLGFGYDNRSIARELNISERTVKRYVTAILTKLRLGSRLQAGLSALIALSSSADPRWPESLMVLGQTEGETDPAWPSSSRVPGVSQGVSMTFDALAALRHAGNPVDLLTPEQQQVLAQLTEDEVTVLNSVRARLDAVSDNEVEGHSSTIKIV